MHAGEMKEFGANCWKNHLCKLSSQKVSVGFFPFRSAALAAVRQLLQE
jgi:hypothetical protein